MQYFARLNTGFVAEVISLPDDLAVADCFHKDVAANIVPCSATTAVGMSYASGAFASPPAPAASGADLLAALDAAQALYLSQVFTFNLGAAPPLTTRLDARGLAAMHTIALWGILNANTPDATKAYSNVDYSSSTITPAEALALAQAALEVSANSFETFNKAAAAIHSTPPSITTLAQIAALFPVVTA